jgi:uncharacterized membrane protein
MSKFLGIKKTLIVQFEVTAGLLETKMTGFVLMRLRTLSTRVSSFKELERKSLCLTHSWIFPLYTSEKSNTEKYLPNGS